MGVWNRARRVLQRRGLLQRAQLLEDMVRATLHNVRDPIQQKIQIGSAVTQAIGLPPECVWFMHPLAKEPMGVGRWLEADTGPMWGSRPLKMKLQYPRTAA